LSTGNLRPAILGEETGRMGGRKNTEKLKIKKASKIEERFDIAEAA
jgi:hypothetical protein